MGRRKDKPAIIYKEDEGQEVAELEEFLFGSTRSKKLLLDRHSDDGEATVADLVHQQARRSAQDAAAAADAADAEPLLFFEDREAGSGAESDDEDVEAGTSGDDEAPALPPGKKRKLQDSTAGVKRPAWHDPYDLKLKVNVAAVPRLRKLRQMKKQTMLTGLKYEQALRRQHEALHPGTEWAQRKPKAARASGLDEDAGELSGDLDKDEDDDALMRTAGGLLAPRSAYLPPGLLESTRVKDANQHDPSSGVVRSVEFHPNGQLLLTAGLDRRLRLFQVDGLRNPKLQSVMFQDMPICRAAFTGAGDHVVAAGRRKHFYVYDLHAARLERVQLQLQQTESQLRSLETFAVSPASGDATAAFLGDAGSITLVSLKARQAFGQLKMNGTARTAAFSADGGQLLTSGGDGVIYTWDMRMRRCLSQQVDEGCVGASSIALSANGRYLATGSSSGVVNIYDHSSSSSSSTSLGAATPQRQQLLPSAPKPLKALMNLTTTVDTLAFSRDAQMLAMASRMRKDALKLVHLPSMTVFSNWPTSRSPLQFVHSVAFSPHGGFLAVGNAKGRVLLYRLHHYSEA